MYDDKIDGSYSIVVVVLVICIYLCLAHNDGLYVRVNTSL